MPSTSNLFFRFISSLVARRAKSKGEVAFFSCTTTNTTHVLFGPLLKYVLFAVRGWSDNHKIFNSIILSISVFMVNVHSFWRVRYTAMLVLPLVRLGGFYAHVYKTVSGFVKAFASNGKHYAHLGKYALTHCFNFWCKCFVCAVRTAWSVVIRIAVGTLPTYNRCAAVWARFGNKFLHTPIVCQ